MNFVRLSDANGFKLFNRLALSGLTDDVVIFLPAVRGMIMVMCLPRASSAV